MNNVVPLQKTPTCNEAEKIIKKLVAEGKVTEQPFLTWINGGGYETTVERTVAGDHLRIGLCLKFTQRVLVITAIKYK